MVIVELDGALVTFLDIWLIWAVKLVSNDKNLEVLVEALTELGLGVVFTKFPLLRID